MNWTRIKTFIMDWLQLLIAVLILQLVALNIWYNIELSKSNAKLIVSNERLTNAIDTQLASNNMLIENNKIILLHRIEANKIALLDSLISIAEQTNKKSNESMTNFERKIRSMSEENKNKIIENIFTNSLELKEKSTTPKLETENKKPIWKKDSFGIWKRVQ